METTRRLERAALLGEIGPEYLQPTEPQHGHFGIAVNQAAIADATDRQAKTSKAPGNWLGGNLRQSWPTIERTMVWMREDHHQRCAAAQVLEGQNFHARDPRKSKTKSIAGLSPQCKKWRIRAN